MIQVKMVVAWTSWQGGQNETWSGKGCILKAEPIGFADRSDLGRERARGIMITPKLSPWNQR